MAIKGVNIDITKPEKYRTRKGYKVINLILVDEPESDFPLHVKYEIKPDNFGFNQLTKEGFNYLDMSESSCDLVEINQPPETKKRKVVQIAAVTTDNGNYDAIYALCDDGKIYYNFNKNDWQEWPPIPQD